MEKEIMRRGLENNKRKRTKTNKKGKRKTKLLSFSFKVINIYAHIFG